MKIKVTYKQTGFNGLYIFTRIIDFTPNRRFFKDKVEEDILSNNKIPNEQYIIEVMSILNYTSEELIEAIKPIVEDYTNDPIDIAYEISQYEKELEINLSE